MPLTDYKPPGFGPALVGQSADHGYQRIQWTHQSGRYRMAVSLVGGSYLWVFTAAPAGLLYDPSDFYGGPIWDAPGQAYSTQFFNLGDLDGGAHPRISALLGGFGEKPGPGSSITCRAAPNEDRMTDLVFGSVSDTSNESSSTKGSNFVSRLNLAAQLGLSDDDTFDFFTGNESDMSAGAQQAVGEFQEENPDTEIGEAGIDGAESVWIEGPRPGESMEEYERRVERSLGDIRF